MDLKRIRAPINRITHHEWLKYTCVQHRSICNWYFWIIKMKKKITLQLNNYNVYQLLLVIGLK